MFTFRATRVVLALILAASLRPAPLTAQQGEPSAAYVPNELIVRLTGGAVSPKLAALLARLGAVATKHFEVVDGLLLIKLPPGMNVAAARRIASRMEGVAYAEPNFLVSTQALPDDPSFPSLWGLHNTGASGGTADADIDAPEAWESTTGSSDVIVALLDTGIDYTHPDLTPNMFRNEVECDGDGNDDDGNGYPDDCYGIDTRNGDSDPMDDNSHGTHTAGILGASGNNGVGVVGVNWTVKLLPCKFLSASGSGATADAITCLDYIAAMKDRGFNIVATNNSWAGGEFSQALLDAIDAQRTRDILFVAAAGNATANNDVTPSYPSNYDLPNVIAVAATTRTDARLEVSSFGRRTVHLGAPGGDILSTAPAGGYRLESGTSMATPHVSGVAALLEAQDPSRDWRAIRNLILAGGDETPAMGPATITGRRLNAFGAVNCSDRPLVARVKPVRSSTTVSVGGPMTLSVININCAAGAGDVTVNVSPSGETVVLHDAGTAGDQQAGDGTYTGQYTPVAPGNYVLTFPDASTVNVVVYLNATYDVRTTAYNYRTITGTNLSVGDDRSATIASPFPIRFGGSTTGTLFVSSNGNVTFDTTNDDYNNVSLPAPGLGSLVATFWDDLVPVPGTSANVFWEVLGSAPYRELVVEWRNVSAFQCSAGSAVTFQVVFSEAIDDIVFNYADTTFEAVCAANLGGSATVGMQTSPTAARQYSFNTASIPSGLSLRWTFPAGTGSPFTDDPLVAGSTIVKAVHFTQLRNRINALRSRYQLPTVAWTDPSIVPGITVIRAIHLQELRTALAEAFQAAGISPTFSQALIVAGSTTITASQIAELRSAVVSLESQ